MERGTGIEPATNSLEGCDSTIELPPHYLLYCRKAERAPSNFLIKTAPFESESKCCPLPCKSVSSLVQRGNANSLDTLRAINLVETDPSQKPSWLIKFGRECLQRSDTYLKTQSCSPPSLRRWLLGSGIETWNGSPLCNSTCFRNSRIASVVVMPRFTKIRSADFLRIEQYVRGSFLF